MGILKATAHRVVRAYPRRWRDRYEAEVLLLLGDSGASWRHVSDLIVGCASEWFQMVLRPEPDQRVRYQAAAISMLLVLGLGLALTASGIARLWQITGAWTPSISVGNISKGVPLVTLVGVLLSMKGSRRVRGRVAWTAVVLTFAGAVLDRFADQPRGIFYGIQSMLWIGIVLTWEDLRTGPYRSRPPLGLSS